RRDSPGRQGPVCGRRRDHRHAEPRAQPSRHGHAGRGIRRARHTIGAGGAVAEDEFISALNVSRIGELSPEEKDRHLTWLWRNRGPLYPLWDGSLMADYAPEFLKL